MFATQILLTSAEAQSVKLALNSKLSDRSIHLQQTNSTFKNLRA